MKKILFALSAVILLAASCAEEREVAVVAHRGFWKCEQAGYATNSVASLKAAQANGFWGSEFDVNMTADDSVLVFHDSSIEGKLINDYPFSEFAGVRIANGETIPQLSDYLAQEAGERKATLVFEIKIGKDKPTEDRCVDICLDQLSRAGLLDPQRVIFISFSQNICEVLAAKTEGFMIQYLENDLSPQQVKDLGLGGKDMDFQFVLEHPEVVKECHDLGLQVNVWTVNKAEDIQAMIDLGVDQITSNEPLLVRELIAKTKGVKEKI